MKNVSCQCLELGVHSEVHRGLPSNTLKGVSVFQGDGGGACVVSLKYFLMDGMELVDAAASLAVVVLGVGDFLVGCGHCCSPRLAW